MSERNEKKDIDGASSKIDLKLDLSPPKRPENENNNNLEETTTMVSDMVLVGCPRCYIYIYIFCYPRKILDALSAKVLILFILPRNNIISRNN
ncbi:hypothetical protein MKW92_051702 [Papaver armeniacum]|nr:hypothetical protein MKW92_051702 [Papaver armeniacum]